MAQRHHFTSLPYAFVHRAVFGTTASSYNRKVAHVPSLMECQAGTVHVDQYSQLLLVIVVISKYLLKYVFLCLHLFVFFFMYIFLIGRRRNELPSYRVYFSCLVLIDPSIQSDPSARTLRVPRWNTSSPSSLDLSDPIAITTKRMTI